MRIAVLGVGLIGGSVALAARERLGAEVTGYDDSPEALERALALGALDCARSTIPAAVAEAEAVFVAVPVGGLSALVGEALAAAPADCVVTDVGSTKREVVAAHDDPRFVGGHPLAGAENAGVEHARADLFEAATWYLTPSSGTSGMLYERLHRLLHGFGARPTAIDADTHDRILAAVSHLPHVLANVLVVAGGRHAGGRRLPPARDRPQLPRRHPGRRRPQRDLDRHLPVQPRRADGRDRRRHRPADGGPRGSARRRRAGDHRVERAGGR